MVSENKRKISPNLPPDWYEHGGVAFPMYQSETMWLSFSRTDYPFAIKVAAGKIDAITGETWSAELTAEPQNYLVLPTQPWLDGFVVRKGVKRSTMTVTGSMSGIAVTPAVVSFISATLGLAKYYRPPAAIPAANCKKL